MFKVAKELDLVSKLKNGKTIYLHHFFPQF